MGTKPHPEFHRIVKAMASVIHDVRPWGGTIFRSAPPKWASSREMISGTGSRKSGARFNAPGSFPAIYGSTTPELAMIESLAYQRRANLPVEHAMPLVFKALVMDVRRLLDLTDSSVLTKLGCSLAEIRDEKWWISRARGEESLTQAVGRAAYRHGIQALLSPSAHTLDRGANIVVFPDQLQRTDYIKVLRKVRKPGPRNGR